MAAASPAPFLSSAALPDLLQAALEISLTGFIFFRPRYSSESPATITDLAYEHLNPAAQQMLRLPECPAESFLTLYPHTVDTGIFAFYRDTFLAGQAGRYDVNYQHDGLDNYFQLTARRAGDLLVVSFSDTAEQPRTGVETALRASQAREQEARAEAEVQRQRFYDVLMQLPAHVAVHEGPDQRFTLANPDYQRIANGRDLVGKPIREAWPELVSHGILDVLDGVYQTGKPYSAAEVPVQVDFTRTGQLEEVYYNFFFRPLRDAQGQITGVLNFSYDVTAFVRARQQVEHSHQQVQQLNEELAAINEELRASNEEYLASNTALGEAQQQLRQLNAEGEARVAERTQQLTQAQAETDTQRQRLHQLVAEAPALIASLRGPVHVVELANEGFRAIFGGRDLVGKPYREAIPEFETQPFFDRLDRVYRTGETYYGIDEPVILDRTNSGRLEHTYITYTYQATRDARGQIDGILVFCYEVTEQVLARQERETQRQRLFGLFQDAPAGIFLLAGPELVFEFVNPRYQQLLSGRELLNRPIFQALPELVGTPIEALLRQVYATGKTREEQGLLIPIARPADGVLEDRYFTFVYQGWRDEQGHVTGVLAFVFEVTEQVDARQQVQNLNQELAAINEELQATNEELNDSNTQLTRTNVDLDNFIYTASHDLKAPITNIEGLLYLLHEELPADVAQAEYVAPTLTHLSGAVERFKRTIDHLTEVSKLQKEHAPANVAVDLAAVVEDVRQDLAPQLRATNAQLTVAVANLPAVLFSEKNLRSVVYNLLSNALKYRHPDRRPHVDVQAHVQGGFTVLEVHDNGLGIGAAYLPRLFTMFQRFHTHVEGTGIGLYMVKRMVENAGGRMAVHSQLGAGTTFFVHLPHAAPSAA